jgi:mono/diheme cytochrome c family protein
MNGRVLVIALAASALLACGSARRSATVQATSAQIVTPEQQRGELVFMRNCNQCHPLGEGGLGPPINNKDLPGVAIKAKVRTGLGLDMPSFSSREISDLELDDLVAYMKALRRNHH